MEKSEVILKNSTGLHARPAGLLVRLAQKFKADITLENEGKVGNCKSLMGLLGIGAGKGAKLSIVVEGEDEKEAINALNHFFEVELVNK